MPVLRKHAKHLPVVLFLCAPAAGFAGESCASVAKAEQVAWATLRENLLEQIAARLSHVDDGSDRHEFLFEGTGDYARPGFHWLITVAKSDCATTFLPGE